MAGGMFASRTNLFALKSKERLSILTGNRSTTGSISPCRMGEGSLRYSSARR